MPVTHGSTVECAVRIVDGTLDVEARSTAARLAAEGFASRQGGPSVLDSTRRLLAEIQSLRTELRAEAVDRFVLAGFGRAAMAAEALAGFADVTLIVLDTTDADQVADALSGDLSRTVLVVCDTSGAAVETDAVRRVFARAFEESAVDAARRTVLVTGGGSAPVGTAEELGARTVFVTDPAGGEALAAHSLVPVGLAGADVAALLDDAASAADVLAVDDADNPCLLLAGVLAAAHSRDAGNVVLIGEDAGTAAFCAWAGSALGTVLLPVVAGSGAGTHDTDAATTAVSFSTRGADPTTATGTHVLGTPAGLFLLWERAATLAAQLLAADPPAGDEPAGGSAPPAVTGETPRFVVDEIETYAGDWLAAGTRGLPEAISALVAAVPDGGHLAVHAYLDRVEDASTFLVRDELARRTGMTTTFDWAQRLPPDKASARRGDALLQITGTPAADIPVPGTRYTLAELQRTHAQAAAAARAERGLPVLRLHLTDRLAGLAALVGAVQAATGIGAAGGQHEDAR